MQTVSYTVALDNFEGPLDLLLHLIERRELPVTDVSISQVTGDYIAYVSALEKADTRELSWFLDLGTRLLSHKTRALGMVAEDGEDDDATDSLEGLTEQLRQLQIMRRAARWVGARSNRYIERPESHSFWRSLPPANVSLQDLVRMHEAVRGRQQPKPVSKHTVKITRIDINHTIKGMIQRISARSGVLQAVRHSSKRQTVAHVLALLELVRRDVWELIDIKGEAHVQPKAS